jgi:TPR repeat protein
MHHKKRWPHWVIALSVTVGIAGPAVAAPSEYIDQALARGDYPQVLAVVVPRAQARDPVAEYQLSLLYANGRGVPQNYVLQAIWCHDAAEQGYAPAQLSLARLYDRGLGVAPDRIASYVWANLAAARWPPGPNLDEALRFRDFARNKLPAPQMYLAQQISVAWRPNITTTEWSPIPLIVAPVIASR